MPLDKIALGASAALQAQEAEALADNAPLRVCIMPDARVVLGVGNIGLHEITDGADLQAAMDTAKAKRADLKTKAATTPAALFTFTRI